MKQITLKLKKEQFEKLEEYRLSYSNDKGKIVNMTEFIRIKLEIN